MNERLRQFEKESKLEIYGLGAKRIPWEAALEKYAELVVKDCLDFLEAGAVNEADDSEVQAALLSCALDILEHFDIELDDKE